MLGIQLVHGRVFTDQEVTRVERLAVVNQMFVKRHSPDREPIGRLVRLPRLQEPPFRTRRRKGPTRDPAGQEFHPGSARILRARCWTRGGTSAFSASLR